MHDSDWLNVTRRYTALHVVTQLSRDVTVTLPWRYKFDRGFKKENYVHTYRKVRINPGSCSTLVIVLYVWYHYLDLPPAWRIHNTKMYVRRYNRSAMIDTPTSCKKRSQKNRVLIQTGTSHCTLWRYDIETFWNLLWYLSWGNTSGGHPIIADYSRTFMIFGSLDPQVSHLLT